MFVSLLGCQPKNPHTLLLGRWECTNLKGLPHVAEGDRAFVMLFQNDGECHSWTEFTDGGRGKTYVSRYSVAGDRLMMGTGEATEVWRFEIRRGRLTMVMVQDGSNSGNVGNTLVFHR